MAIPTAVHPISAISATSIASGGMRPRKTSYVLRLTEVRGDASRPAGPVVVFIPGSLLSVRARGTATRWIQFARDSLHCPG